jgi:hypothetical protein
MKNLKKFVIAAVTLAVLMTASPRKAKADTTSTVIAVTNAVEIFLELNTEPPPPPPPPPPKIPWW